MTMSRGKEMHAKPLNWCLPSTLPRLIFHFLRASSSHCRQTHRLGTARKTIETFPAWKSADRPRRLKRWRAGSDNSGVGDSCRWMFAQLYSSRKVFPDTTKSKPEIGCWLVTRGLSSLWVHVASRLSQINEVPRENAESPRTFSSAWVIKQHFSINCRPKKTANHPLSLPWCVLLSFFLLLGALLATSPASAVNRAA